MCVIPRCAAGADFAENVVFRILRDPAMRGEGIPAAIRKRQNYEKNRAVFMVRDGAVL